MSAKSHRSSTVSPLRSRRSPAVGPTRRPVTPSSQLSAPPTTSYNVALSSSAIPSTSFTYRPSSSAASDPDAVNTKPEENITVTVRFRPLSPRESHSGDEIAWYADGDYAIRNEYNPSTCYGFDRVFGPATTTRRVYDVAAQHVVSGAMQGINGTVFAYGVTSSGKTHTMHGEQRSPGIIPLAVKDVFGIIQETPEREFLLRVSYLEIYNEVINDLLDPTGQNLKIREDAQGTYVEGIKDEVVLSPAHVLSLIATGEEHRHVGSNNVNLFSSRSHTIFTLTVESSPHGKGEDGEDVTLSQLHLIDLAGSESSRTEISGLRRKEGSCINKSLLTLGTVISKLTDPKAVHIPYRDSKLTRLLQSTLSGHGRVSLICTITPASGSSEETHNTLKFAQRCKHVEIKASRNKIMDEKSLIKRYQKEISGLKEELQQMRPGMSTSMANQDDSANIKHQLEAGQYKFQSKLDDEEEARAALMGRIQRLTKLILVSTKNSMQSNTIGNHTDRLRHSFREDELVYLPERRRENMVEKDIGSSVSESSKDYVNETAKDLKRNKNRGMLGWLKLKKSDGFAHNPSHASGPHASSSKSLQKKSMSKRKEIPSAIKTSPERTLMAGRTIVDQMDLLHEQTKILVGEVVLRTSSLNRLLEQAANNPEDPQINDQIEKLDDEISEKKHQIHALEQQMVSSLIMTHTTKPHELSQALSKLTTQLSEKIFEYEIKSADNRILQEQLQMTKSDNAEMQETIILLRQQLDSIAEKKSPNSQKIQENESSTGNRKGEKIEVYIDGGGTPTSVMSLNRILSQEETKEIKDDITLNSEKVEIERLKKENMRLEEEKDEAEEEKKKLAEEASYAKELASAAALELQSLAAEVARLCHGGNP